MVTLISRTELEKQPSDNKNEHLAGVVYPQMFSGDEKINFRKNMKMKTGIIWLGSYKLDNRLFQRKKCPVCGKEEVLIPYRTIGSILSGCHTIQFYCSHCKELFVTNDDIEYFRSIYRYILNQRKEKSLKNEGNCTSVPENAIFISTEDNKANN